MNGERPYTYTVLRYVHDLVTGEFVNVGVVLHAPKDGFFDARIGRCTERWRAAFPDLDEKALIETLDSVRKGVASLTREVSVRSLLTASADVASLMAKVLPPDDSALQWSVPVGSGLSADPAAALERLFERHVTRYAGHAMLDVTAALDLSQPRGQAAEPALWRSVEERLRVRGLLVHLRPCTITGRADTIEAAHTWTNGMLNIAEPLSLDYVRAAGIRARARQWRGQIDAAAQGPEPFRVHFIVRPPENPELDKEVELSLEILRGAAHEPRIYLERDAEELVDQIDRDVRSHAAT